MIKKIFTKLNNRKFISISVSVFVGLALLTSLWFFNNENSKHRQGDIEVHANELSELENIVDYQKVIIEDYVGDKIIIFHNGIGEKTKQARGFVSTLTYPVEEYTYPEGSSKGYFLGLKDFYKISSGESESFGYFPIIFIGENAYSGFNDEIQEAVINYIYSDIDEGIAVVE